MQSLNQIIQKLMKNQEIVTTVEKLLNLYEEIGYLLNHNQELKWDATTFRKFLEEKLNLSKWKSENILFSMKEEIKKRIEAKIDAIIRPSIADYRRDWWQDERPALPNYVKVFEEDEIEANILEYPQDLFRKKLLLLKSNKVVLINKPLETWEWIDLNNRLIYSIFGGKENIKNITVETKTYLCETNSYEVKYLKINVKNESKVNEIWNKYENFYSTDFSHYWQYLNLNSEIEFFRAKIIYIKDQEEEFINFEKTNGNYFLPIKWNDIIKIIVNNLIRQWKESITFNLKNKSYDEIINSQWKKANLDNFINDYKEKYFKWKENENLICQLEKVLKLIIIDTFDSDLTFLLRYPEEEIWRSLFATVTKNKKIK